MVVPVIEEAAAAAAEALAAVAGIAERDVTAARQDADEEMVKGGMTRGILETQTSIPVEREEKSQVARHGESVGMEVSPVSVAEGTAAATVVTQRARVEEGKATPQPEALWLGMLQVEALQGMTVLTHKVRVGEGDATLVAPCLWLRLLQVEALEGMAVATMAPQRAQIGEGDATLVAQDLRLRLIRKLSAGRSAPQQ